MEQTPRQLPSNPSCPPSARRAVDDHGRAVTAGWQAARWYRHAQRCLDLGGAAAALRLALRSDPTFALAAADLDAITGGGPSPVEGRLMTWERHHIEVVRRASAQDLDRAADLLRELVAAIGCDPLAMRIVLDLAERTGNTRQLDDLTSQTRGCHQARH